MNKPMNNHNESNSNALVLMNQRNPLQCGAGA
jgi:hypothetical protein